MADVSTVSDSEAHEAAPVLGCAFFEVLPTELRLLIYEIAFHGSRVHASLFDYKRAYTQIPALMLRHSSHFDLLLSCRKIYHEALAIFWSVTVLEFAQPLERSRMMRFEQANVRPDTYAHLLCSALPKELKMKIRHVKGMVLPELRGDFVRDNPSCTATALLSNFKNLATCDILPTLARHPALFHEVKRLYDLGIEDFDRITAHTGQEPRDYLADRYGIDTTTEIVFLGKTLVKIPTSEKDTEQISNTGFYRAVSCRPGGPRLYSHPWLTMFIFSDSILELFSRYNFCRRGSQCR